MCHYNTLTENGYIGIVTKREDAIQIVDRVNACLPLENPEQDIKKIIETLRQLKELRQKPLNFTMDETREILDSVDKALSLYKEYK